MHIHLIITLIFAKAVYYVSSFLNIGSGYTWPGHIALKLYPSLLQNVEHFFNEGVIFITGTNGKTTTTKLLSHVLEKRGHTVLTNSTGANLVNGIASSILVQLSLSKVWKGEGIDYGVFEVDEFALRALVQDEGFLPEHLVFLNLSRDQLDRYGEVDTILKNWAGMLDQLHFFGTHIHFHQDQPEFKLLLNDYGGQVHVFSRLSGLSEVPKALQTLHNEINLAAAQSVLLRLGSGTPLNAGDLSDFKMAYGRGEILEVGSKEVHLYLAKNPSSFNLNLELLANFNAGKTAVLVVLNDNVPDGHDISWIYDISSEKLHLSLQGFSHICFSGRRGFDMATRFKYAGLEISADQVFSSHKKAFAELVRLEGVDTILVFPNYSAMLEVRKVLTGRSIL